MFNVKINRLPKSLVEIICEAPCDDFDKAYVKTLSELKQQAEIDGFRKGFAPEKILIEKIGERKILEEAAEELIQKTYFEILEKNNLEIIGQPEIHILKIAKGNPLEFKIIVAILPEVKLPDYKKISKQVFEKKEEIKIEEKEIKERLEQLKNALEAKSGKKEELNDEFAKKAGNFQNLEELKKVIVQNLEFEKKTKARDKKRMEVLDKIAGETKIDFPRILVDAEKGKMFGELKKSVSEMGLGWDDYLKQIKKSEEELLKSFESEAERRVNFGLILREIAIQEEIEVGEEEVEKLSENYAKIYSEEKINRDYIYGLLKNEKTFAFLENLN